MYVLMEHRSPERRANTVQPQERHLKPMLRGRVVMHHSPANKELLRGRQPSIDEEKANSIRRRQFPGKKSSINTHHSIPTVPPSTLIMTQPRLPIRTPISSVTTHSKSGDKNTLHSIIPSCSQQQQQQQIASTAIQVQVPHRHLIPNKPNVNGQFKNLTNSFVFSQPINGRDNSVGPSLPTSPYLIQRQVHYTSKVRPVENNKSADQEKSKNGRNKQQEEKANNKSMENLTECEKEIKNEEIQSQTKITEAMKNTDRKTEQETAENLQLMSNELTRQWRERTIYLDREPSDEPVEQPNRFLFGASKLVRSKSQSRGTLISTTTCKQQQDQFLLMGRSKTSSNLATNSGTLRPITRFIGVGAVANNRRKHYTPNNKQKPPAFLADQSAVIELFDAVESQRWRESWERTGGGQFGRVQRELRALAERRELGLGRTRKIRIADLGADQFLAKGSNAIMLQKPRQKPLQDYYNDDDAELEAIANLVDPTAPQSTGQLITPCRGDFAGGNPPPALPRSIDSVLFKWANTQPKVVAAQQLDSAGKTASTLTYGKLLSRATKIAYALLNRQVTVIGPSRNKERVQLCLPGDRVALIYPNSDAPAFICAFYGCLLAGVVPVPIEVPTIKRDAAGLQQFGFLLGSCGVRVALTTERCLKGLPKAQHSNPGSSLIASPSSTNSGFSSANSNQSQRDFYCSSPQSTSSSNPNDMADFKGWPRLHWMVTEQLGKPSKEWTLPSLLADNSIAYIEYTTDKEGAVKGVASTRQALLAHARAVGAALEYKEGQNLICVIDFKREAGLWHACIAGITCGMRITFVPYLLMKVNPTCWLQHVTRQQTQFAVVKSRDLHWSLMAVCDHAQLQLSSLRCILVTDGANPWSLSSCDQFISVFKSRGLWHGALCPCAGSSEAGTVALRRPNRPDETSLINGAPQNFGSGRGVLSMLALSHCVIRVDQQNSLNSLALQDTGHVLPGGMAVVVKLNGPPKLCRADEIGEICLHAASTADNYHGLKGLSQTIFAVSPLNNDEKPIGPLQYVRSGLVGFLGPEGLIFAVGSKISLLHVSGRVHSADDLIATVLAVEPIKFIYRGRIAVFSVRVLRDERVCIVAEQRMDVSEEDAFAWMVRVLQAIDSIHQLGVYCLCLVPSNQLPKTPLGGIHITETRQRFLDGCLHPNTLLMCPQNCILNLPKPREPPADVGPAAMFVGNIVQGIRIAGAEGMELPICADESVNLADILRQRAQQTPDHVLYSLLNCRGIEVDSLTCAQLLKRAERISALLLEKGRLTLGDHVALIFPAGLDLIAAVFGCFCACLVPVCIRPPSPQNLHTSMMTVRMIVDVSKAVALLSNSALIKLLKSKEVSHRVNTKAWPTILDIEDAPSLSVARNRARRMGDNDSIGMPTREPAEICYLDFAVSTTGQLSGVQMTHQGAANQCKSLKVACELYPSRNVTLCLDPSSGVGFTLWCLSSVYSGHQSTLIPPLEIEQNPQVWLQALTQNKSRDTFCSNSVMEHCVRELASLVGQLKDKGINLSSLRNCIVVAEERPRVQLCNAFIKLFAPLGLSSRAVSTSFGCRVNPAICMQGAASPDPSSVYVDAKALCNDRVTLVEKGAPHSICLMESGKLLPGVKVAIANPKTLGQCADTHLGEIWVSSGHNAAGFFSLFGEEARLQTDHFNARLSTGDTKTIWSRTGYLGFLRQTQAITADGELHDALFVVGALDETLLLRGMRYHPVDIELGVNRAHRQICESACFTWTHLLVVVAETTAQENEALDLVPAITSTVLEEQHLIIGVVVIVDPGTIPVNSRGEKQRTHLRELFLKDQLNPIYVSYNL